MKTKRMILMAAVAMMTATASGAGAAQQVQQTVSLDPDGKVNIEIPAGTLLVEAWDRAEVEIQGTMDDKGDLTISGGGDLWTIEIEYPSSWFSESLFKHSDCNLTLKVPRGASVEAEGISTDLTFREVEGEIAAESVSGKIEVHGRPSAVYLEAVSGDITIRGAQREVRVEAVSGDIEVTMDQGRIELEGVSGDITVQGGVFDRVELSSVSGDIDFRGSLSKSGRMDVDCHSGDVDVFFQGEVSAKLSLDTFSGDIISELGGTVRKESDFVPARELDHTVGGGDSKVNISGFSGTIRVRK